MTIHLQNPYVRSLPAGSRDLAQFVVQKQHEKDIVALLKAHPEIHAVNGDWTELGLMEQEKMKDMFSNMSR